MRKDGRGHARRSLAKRPRGSQVNAQLRIQRLRDSGQNQERWIGDTAFKLGYIRPIDIGSQCKRLLRQPGVLAGESQLAGQVKEEGFMSRITHP